MIKKVKPGRATFNGVEITPSGDEELKRLHKPVKRIDHNNRRRLLRRK